MNFMKEETALMFDVSKLKVGSIIMIHYSDSERYGMVDYVSPTNISIGREDGTSVSILSTDVYLDKENPVEGKVFLDVISPEEMYHIFDSRMALSTSAGAHEMHKIIEECASEGSIASRLFVKAYAKQTEDKCTVLLKEELRAAITDGIPLEHLETICAAYKDGRLMTLPKHRLANGSKAWTIDQYGDIQEGTISYCTSEYSMYFACKVCGFPFMNSDIGKIVFQTRLEAETYKSGYRVGHRSGKRYAAYL